MSDPTHSAGDPTKRPALSAVAPALLAALAFGVCAPAGKRIFKDVDPMLAGAWTNVTAAIAVSVALLVRPGRREDRLSRADLPWIGAAAGAGSLLAPWAFFAGLARTEAHVASALLYLEGALTATLATVFFGERLGLLGVGGVLLVTAGAVACALLSASDPASPAGLGGALWILLACALWALDTNCLRRVAHRDALRTTRAKCLTGGLGALAVSQVLSAPLSSLPLDTALLGAAYGAVGIGASVALFVASLRAIGAARAGAIFGAYPLVGIAVSVVFLHERPSPWVLAAAAGMAVGVLLVAADAGRGQPGPERAEGRKAV